MKLNNKGFTVVELLIVVATITIGIGIFLFVKSGFDRIDDAISKRNQRFNSMYERCIKDGNKDYDCYGKVYGD